MAPRSSPHVGGIGGQLASLGEPLADRPSASSLVAQNRGGDASLVIVDGDEADTGVEAVE